ncbi:cytochrome P450 [Mycena galopus ATCC 62051]|nr:cytochrome P450 [Mycena galopus ATCC 62051]
MAFGRRRKDRQLLYQAMNAVTAQNYRPMERAACHELLRSLLQDPSDTMKRLRHMARSTIMSVAHGIHVLPTDDPVTALARDALETIVVASIPGRFCVDFIPALKYVPEWVPGTGFKRMAKEWRKRATDMMELPFAEAKRIIANLIPCLASITQFQKASGNAPTSFVSVSLSSIDESEDKKVQEQAVKVMARTICVGGADTTVSALGTFVLTMLANPEFKKAQTEIDSVIGDNDLPDFQDEEALPYLSALVKEVLRWRSVTPIGRYSTEENLFLISSNLKTNIHFLLNGKLNPAVRSPEAFGFGCRICPGRHMAHDSVWLNIVSILATFDITKAIGDGRIIAPTYEYFTALVSMALPFKCTITPRSQRAIEVIRATAEEEDS